MSLILQQHPVCEPVTLEEVCLFLKIDHRNEDTLLNHLIKTARQAIEAYTSKSLIKQVWCLTTSFDYCVSISDQDFLRRDALKSLKGLELPKSPFIKLMEPPKIITPYGSIEISDFSIDTNKNMAKFHLSPYRSLSDCLSVKKLQIVFQAGYGESPEDVPSPLRHAMLLCIADLYEKRLSVNDNQALFSAFLKLPVLTLIDSYRHIRLN